MQFVGILKPGTYWIFNIFKKVNVISVFVGKSTEVVSNQLISTKENVDIKISYFIDYMIDDPIKFMNSYDLFSQQLLNIVKQDIHLRSQVLLRDLVSKMTLTDVLNSRKDLSDTINAEMIKMFKEKGIKIESVTIRDIGLKTEIRNIYSEEYLVDRKAKLALANARAQVASSRAMANAAKILSENANIKFLKILEALESISKKPGNNIHVHIGNGE